MDFDDALKRARDARQSELDAADAEAKRRLQIKSADGAQAKLLLPEVRMAVEALQQSGERIDAMNATPIDRARAPKSLSYRHGVAQVYGTREAKARRSSVSNQVYILLKGWWVRSSGPSEIYVPRKGPASDRNGGTLEQIAEEGHFWILSQGSGKNEFDEYTASGIFNSFMSTVATYLSYQDIG